MTADAPSAPGLGRDFRLLLSGQAVSALGSQACTLAFPLVALALTGSPAMAGLLGFVAAAPALLLQVPAGVVVDRLDRRRVMLVCDAGRLVLMVVLAGAAAVGSLSLPVLLGLAALYAAVSVVFGLAQTAAVPSVVTSVELPRAIARTHATMQGAAVAGRPVGGWLFGLGAAMPFAVNAVSYAVSLVTLLRLRSDLSAGRSDVTPERPSWRHEAQEGLRFVWRTPLLRALSMFSAASTLLSGGFMLVLLVLLGGLGADPAVIGLLFGACGVAGIVGATLAPALVRALGSGRVFVLCIGATAVMTVALAFATQVWHVGVAAAAIVALGPPAAIVLQVARVRAIPRGMFGRVHAVENTIGASTAPVSALLAGIALEYVGPVATCAAIGVGLLVLTLVALMTPSLRVIPDSADSDAGDDAGGPRAGGPGGGAVGRAGEAPVRGRHRRAAGTPVPASLTLRPGHRRPVHRRAAPSWRYRAAKRKNRPTTTTTTRNTKTTTPATV